VVVSSRAGELDGYAGFAVTGQCGPIDASLSQRVLLEPFGPGGKPSAGLRGMCFDPASWDGSDLFTPKKTAAICVRASVRQALLDTGTAAGCEFRLMSQVTWPVEG
jgi:hypothetical protein